MAVSGEISIPKWSDFSLLNSTALSNTEIYFNPKMV